MLLCFSGTLCAQSVTVNKQSDGTKTTITRILPKRVDQHDIRLGVGSLSLASDMFMDAFYFGMVDVDSGYPYLPTQMTNATTRRTDRRFWGIYSLSYTYHSRRWLQFGGTVSCGIITQSRHDLNTDKVVADMGNYAVSIMPTVRFVYLYRERVQLYSAISGGVVYNTYEWCP